MTSNAIAQYVWLDDKGHKQFSDQPPPITVPKSKILRSPDKTTSTSDSTPAGHDAVPGEIKKPKTIAEQELMFNKQRAEREEKNKKAADDAKKIADKNDNCRRIASYQQSLSSGERIKQTGPDGEQSYMSDTQRADEQRIVQKRAEECK